jgi:hypothetical protein
VTTVRKQSLCLIFTFLVLIGLVAPVEGILARRAGEPSRLVDLFRRMPTSASLRRLESDLESRSRLAQAVRPWMQFLRFAALRDAGDKALLGRDGWFFYRPAVQYLVEPYAPQRDMFDAIVSFRDALAQRGIELLLMPAPNKASVYPEKLAARATEGAAPVNVTTRDVLTRLREAGVEVLDLFDIFEQAKAAPGAPACYLAQDSHWSPDGMRLAAEAAARRLVHLGWVQRRTSRYETKSVPVQRHGDVLTMIRVPRVEYLFEPESLDCTQVIDAALGRPYADDPNAPVLVLGDSFLRIFERDEPGSGGFVAHLAYQLGFGLSSIINDGGASTLVRQQLSRKPGLLEGKRVVVWEFVERDIRFGTEGWQIIPLGDH